MANVKPGRAKDNARANVDVPKRKSAEGTARRDPDDDRGRGARMVESAEEVYAAMRVLLARRERLTAAIHTLEGYIADPTTAPPSPLSGDVQIYVWKQTRACRVRDREILDRAVFIASERRDGLVALAIFGGHAPTLPGTHERQRERLTLYAVAEEAVEAYLRARRSKPLLESAAWTLLVLNTAWGDEWAFERQWEPHEPALRPEGPGRLSQPEAQAKAAEIRARLVEACRGRQPKARASGEVREIIRNVIGVNPTSVKTLARRVK